MQNKMTTTKTMPENQKTDASIPTTKTIFYAFAGLFILNLLLRVFYLRFDFVNGDEAVRALTATEWLDGARLYVDIVTDKPPATTFFYAAVFKFFGRSMDAIHLAATVWNFFTAIVVFLIAKKIYGVRAALLSALVFVYFSTNYFTQDMMAANTELLMALPYSASFYFFLRAQNSENRRITLDLFFAGLLTGVAIAFKQIGVFNLLCFTLTELWLIYAMRKTRPLIQAILLSSKRLAMIALGVVVVFACVLLWLYQAESLGDFWRNVFVVNTFYISSLPGDLWLKFMVGRTLGYIFFNLTLWALAACTIRRVIKRKDNRKSFQPSFAVNPEGVIGLWALASWSGAFTGGRFFGHYFIQMLPALAILAAGSGEWLIEQVKNPGRKRRALLATGLLLFFFIIGLVRMHNRTAILAYETLTGTRTRLSEAWGMTVRERETAIVAKRLRERLNAGDRLYIWDYALDVYWRSGCRPASRYLQPYYLTGNFTDSNLDVAETNQNFYSPAHAQFIEDLKRHRPRIILDLSDTFLRLPFREITDFIKTHYERDTEIGVEPGRPFVVYQLKENF
ncbi:MAG: glycosyltransferase family 39 protein [Acidobacteriota bacterium]